MVLEMRIKKEPHLGKCDSRPGRTLLSLGTLFTESPEVHFQRTSFVCIPDCYALPFRNGRAMSVALFSPVILRMTCATRLCHPGERWHT